MPVPPAPSDRRLQQHYGHSDLTAAIRTALASMGLSPTTVTRADLRPVDEFHIGGHAATTALFDRLSPNPHSWVLDIGCGIGGPARHIADQYQCAVTGIDLSADYIACGTTLNRWLQLDDKVTLLQGSALAMPLADTSFDLAVMLHVGMNIADKAALMREIARLLVPGGRLAIYDVMQTGDAAPEYPLPWAEDASLSAVCHPSLYRDAITAAGLTIASEIDHTAMAVSFFDAAANAPSQPLSLRLLMRETTPEKMRNVARQIKNGTLAPTEIIAEKPNG